MIYECIKPHRHLTVGKRYGCIMPNENVMNIVVWNDNGRPQYFPKDEFFKKIADSAAL